MRRHWRLIVGVIAAVVLVIGVAGSVWLSDLADPTPEAEAAMVSSQAVSVTSEPWLTFTPLDAASTGFILYPGGRCRTRA